MDAPKTISLNRVVYSTHYLDNGLKIIVQPDLTVSKVVVNLLYRVGSRDESPERTGLAHLFEHLMFGGSKNIENYDEHVQRIGGENNAFTSADITNYYAIAPANQLETLFWLESDRMLELAFTPKSLEVQRSVVCEEFKQRYLNQPYGDPYLLLRPLMFQVHPYQWMTIGKSLEHIEVVTLDEVKDFFYSHYAPNNCTLVVAGGVTADDVLPLAEKWFGSIPSRTLKHNPRPTEPLQTAPRRLEVERPVPYNAIYKGYHAPARIDAAFYASDLVTDVLSNGKTSRLYQALVKNQPLCSSVNAYTWGLLDPSIISIEMRLRENVSFEQAEQALEAELKKLQTIQPDELFRIKNKIETNETFDKAAVMNRAIALAMYDTIGDPELINTVNEHYQTVTPEAIQAAALQYLDLNNCSTLIYRAQN